MHTKRDNIKTNVKKEVIMKRKVISTVIAACMVVGTMASFGTSVNAAIIKIGRQWRKGYIKTFP